ncbi:hypothetical protein IM538_18590 [Cytobacillus suaedae]|nr:hypothetical protein IM538_18590 [Cytobacillus suaedae]
MKSKLRCPVCREYVRSNDLVFLDQFNGIRHQTCEQPEQLMHLKDTDKGTFIELVDKYSFFKEVFPQ